MKNLYLIIGFILILINSIFGWLFTFYPLLNCLISNFVIIINIILLLILGRSDINDGFKISLSFIYSFIGFVTFILSIGLNNQLQNNYKLALIIILVAIQTLLLFIVRRFKNSTR
jgi:hypothetical protein